MKLTIHLNSLGLLLSKSVRVRDRGWSVKMSSSEPNFSLSGAIFSKLQVEKPPASPEKTQQDGITRIFCGL